MVEKVSGVVSGVKNICCEELLGSMEKLKQIRIRIDVDGFRLPRTSNAVSKRSECRTASTSAASAAREGADTCG